MVTAASLGAPATVTLASLPTTSRTVRTLLVLSWPHADCFPYRGGRAHSCVKAFLLAGMLPRACRPPKLRLLIIFHETHQESSAPAPRDPCIPQAHEMVFETQGWACTSSSLARCTRVSGGRAASTAGASSACTTGSSGPVRPGAWSLPPCTRLIVRCCSDRCQEPDAVEYCDCMGC